MFNLPIDPDVSIGRLSPEQLRFAQLRSYSVNGFTFGEVLIREAHELSQGCILFS
jgi:hypothetical protein